MTVPPTGRRWSGRLRLPGRRKLSTRLLLAQGIVLVASILTAALVAAIVGPSLFHQHLVESGHVPDPPELEHIEEAYRTASAISLGVALLIALTCALAVTWYLTTRLQRPLSALTTAAERMSASAYATRVHLDNAGPELASVAAAFNAMAERLQTVEETRRRLLSDLAHEMRTPIATMGAHLDGLEDGVIAWDDRTMEVLRHQTDRLRRLAEDIGDVSRAEEGRLDLQLEPAPAADLIASAVDANRASYAEKGVLLEAGATDPALNALVDPERFAQVLGNLLNNARRHTPSGGTVTLAGVRTADGVEFTVRDTGDGIRPDQLPHVFERFYRGDQARDRERQGSGIGLTISKAIVEAHGGTLSATSAGPGTGATFTAIVRAAPAS
jgi:two-component system sensor histidine kinase BaeS